jgi:hypothetical protein
MAQKAVPTGVTLYFAHIANGMATNGDWNTDFSFVNISSSTATGTLNLFDDNGAPLTLPTNQGTASSFNMMIAPGGQFDIVTMGAGGVVGGYAIATFNHGVIGSATYALSTTAGGEVVSVGVLSSHGGRNFISPATFGMGIAIANLSGGITDSMTLQALDLSGNVAGSVNLMLAPRHHMANNLNVLIPTLASTFVGSIRLSGMTGIALAIGVKNNTTGFVSWSLPALTYNSPPSSASGTFNVTTGPDTGASGTISLTNFEVTGEDFLTGTISITFKGTTVSGPLFVNVDPFGLLVSFYFTIPGYPNAGRGLAPQPPSGSNTISGYVVDFGNGDGGTFTLTLM